MGYDGLSFPVPASTNKDKVEGDPAFTNTDWDKDISGAGSLATVHDDLSFLTEGDSDRSLTLQPFSQRLHQQPLLTLASSRRNSRMLPNPIQPPTPSHARKQSMDDPIFRDEDQSQDKSIHPFSASTSSTTFSDLSIPEDDSMTVSSSMSSFSNSSSQGGNIQHGGFVPGYDPWAAKSDKISSSVTGQDIQNHRRNSESVLHDLSASNLDYLTMKSTYHSSDTRNAPSGSSIPLYLPGRPSSPTSSAPPGEVSLSGPFASSRTLGMRPGSLSYEAYPLPPTGSRDSGVTGVDTRAPGHHLSSTQPALHPHFETIPVDSGSTHHLNDGAATELCVLCGVQLATVHLGACGHRYSIRD